MNLRKNLSCFCGAKFYKYFVLSAFLLTGFAVSVNAVTLSQSSSNTITAANSVACTNNSTGATTQNSYWRAYSLSTLGSTGFFNITSVTFGIETAEAGTGTTQPATINLYTNTGAAFPGGTRTLIKTATTNIPDQSLTLLTVPIFTAVPIATGNQLVVEVNIPDGTTAGNTFFFGSNAAPETAPGYISAPDCGITTPTTFAAVGFPNTHIVLNINGTVSSPSAASVTVGGRITSGSRGITNVRVTLTDENGSTRSVLSSQLGYYRFADVEAGKTYTIEATGKRFWFANPVQVRSIVADTSDVDFQADN